LSFIDVGEQALAEARLGTQLAGRWRITELLGIGGTSVVYGGEHRNGHLVAIKLLRPELAADPQIASRFLSEGYVANKIGHPAIVAILDDDRTDDGIPFLVMERLDGESLHWRLRRCGAFHPVEILVVADRVLEALEAAHEKGVLHRDLKPENIFLTRRRDIKLLDFGIARCQKGELLRPGTLSGTVMGTPAFMSPEQARGQWSLVNERSDLFSLSASLFVLLTDRAPRNAETPNLELLAAMTQPFPKLRDVWPAAPPGMAALLDRGLSLEPEARWSSAREMRAAVHAVWAELSHVGVPLGMSLEGAGGALFASAPPERSTAECTPAGATTAMMTMPTLGKHAGVGAPVGAFESAPVGRAALSAFESAPFGRAALSAPSKRSAPQKGAGGRWVWMVAGAIALVASASALRWAKRGMVAAHETEAPAVETASSAGAPFGSSFVEPAPEVSATPAPASSEVTVPVESIPSIPKAAAWSSECRTPEGSGLKRTAPRAPAWAGSAPAHRAPSLPSTPPNAASVPAPPAVSARPYDPFERRR
jgi:serine/threonine-protein kinase